MHSPKTTTTTQPASGWGLVLSLTHLKYCYRAPKIYTAREVKLGWFKRTLALAATAFLVAGCSGINTQQTINPLMFFLPGIGQTKPAEKQQTAPTQTASLTHIAGDTTDSVQLN
jgi:hypothetical protein